ncbi:MAG: hypothetical protein AAGD05_03180, partial [Bacteroidota bacterium]
VSLNLFLVFSVTWLGQLFLPLAILELLLSTAIGLLLFTIISYGVKGRRSKKGSKVRSPKKLVKPSKEYTSPS